MARRVPPVARAAAALIAAAVLASCSGPAEGSASPAEHPGSTTSSTTSSSTTTTTAPPGPAAKPQTIELATAATLGAGDFGEGWVERQEGTTNVPTRNGSCSWRRNGPERKLRTGASQRGPLMQLRDEPATITSTSYVFPDAQRAVQWIETVRSDEWAECTLEHLVEDWGGDDGELELTLDSRQIEHLGENGFESFAQYYGRDEHGEVRLVVNVMHYRMGRVVLENTLERDPVIDPADWAAVDASHGMAVAGVWARLNELVR